MLDRSSTALPKSQAELHCRGKAKLYAYGMSIGKRILRARIARGLTKEQVAEQFGISKQAVHDWETKPDGQPSADKLAKLREILKVTFAWLHEGGDTPPPEPDDPEVLIESRTVKLYRKERSGAA
jgi:transcriptional regulator with XRE-family HTH domain